MSAIEKRLQKLEGLLEPDNDAATERLLKSLSYSQLQALCSLMEKVQRWQGTGENQPLTEQEVTLIPWLEQWHMTVESKDKRKKP